MIFSGLPRIFCLITAVICLAWADQWQYGQEDQWPGKCLKGKQQSPINLQMHNTDERQFPLIQFIHYEENFEATLTNNGHSVMLKLINPEARPYIKGGGLPYDYILDHLHFHWGSEHTVHSNRFPLELHLVHYAKKFNSTSDAVESASQQALAVIGVLFDLNKESNSGFGGEFMAILGEVENNLKVDKKISDKIQIFEFLPKDLTGFYRYEGSLTTPSCDESVVWTIFTDSAKISEDKLEKFHKIHSAIGPLSENYRALQDINGRTVTLRRSTHQNSGHLMLPTPILIILVLLTRIL